MHIVYVTETWPPEVNGVAFTAARAVQHLRSACHAVQLVRPRQRAEPERDDGEEWRTAGCPIPMYPALRFGWASAASFRERWRERSPDLVHVATLNETFDPTFTVNGFTQAGGLWTQAIDSSKYYQFSQSTGLLSVVAAPEPASLSVLMLGGFILLRRRKSC